jgi:hypothetical protein
MNGFYYSSDKKVFKNKIDALKYSKSTNNTIYFYYHDDVYSKLDWSIEPPGDLDFYYKMQAQRIRDEYDYVVLFYSGGYDSTNILETFFYNNIPLDKIVCVGAFKQDSASGVDENHNGELYHNAFPLIVSLGLEKITQICDYTDYFDDIKNFSIYNYGEQWIENVGPWFSPHHWFWYDIHKYVVPENMQGKKVALVWGKDKANLSLIQGRHGFEFNDAAALGYGGNLGLNNNIDKINFYWDPNNPLLVVKQVHELKKAKEYRDPNILYKLKSPIRFKSPKSPTKILSLRDNFLKSKPNSSIFDFYSLGIKILNQAVNIKTDLDPIKSRFYVLDK